MFPIMASFGLFGLFLAFMWFPKEYVNMVLTAYFLIFGVGAITSTIAPLFDKLFGAKEEDKSHFELKIPFTSSEILSILFNFEWIIILEFLFINGLIF